MSMEDCKIAARAATKGALSNDEIDSLVNRIVSLADQMRAANPALDDATARTKAAEVLTDEEMLAAGLARRARLFAAKTRAMRAQFFGQFAEGQEAAAMGAITTGREGSLPGEGRSVDAVANALKKDWMGQLLNGIRKAGLADFLLSPWKGEDKGFMLEVVREMYRAAHEPGSPELEHVPESKDARAIIAGRMLHSIVEQTRVAMNDAGAFIRKMPGYMVRQTHDAVKVRGGIWRSISKVAREAAFVAWRDFILPRLDHARTFGEMTQGDIEKYMRSAWTHIITGQHERAPGAEDWLSGFIPKGALARKVSEERVFHFKSPDAWFEYNNKFGKGSLIETFMSQIGRSAQSVALMRTFGPSPRAAFEADIQAFKDRAIQRGDDRAVQALDGWRIKAEFDAVEGALSAVDPRVGTIVRGIKTQQMLSKLGMMLFSSFSDIANRSAVLRHNGIGLLEGYSSFVNSAVDGVAAEDRAEALDLIGAFADGALGSMTERFSTSTGANSAGSKMTSIFYRANGFHHFTQHLRRGTVEMLSSKLAREAGTVFGDLDPLLQKSLTRYGIQAPEWEMIRKGAVHIPERRRAYLTTDAIDYIPDAELAVYANVPKNASPEVRASVIREARTELRISLQSYFSENELDAATEPRARERALLSMGVKPGSPAWIANQFFWQFKSFGVTSWTRHMARELERGGGGSATAWGIAHMIVGSTILGAVGMTAKDLLKGRTPRDFSNPATWGAAMMQGGGFGIYGDFLMADYNRFGQGWLETLAGPVIGTTGQFLSILASVRDGNDAKAKAVKFGIDQTPFINLFYTRMALDYLILYHIQEALNPGYLKRMERRIKKENNQEFMLPPSQVIR